MAAISAEGAGCVPAPDHTLYLPDSFAKLHREERQIKDQEEDKRHRIGQECRQIASRGFPFANQHKHEPLNQYS
jgi:hypothetical protein